MNEEQREILVKKKVYDLLFPLTDLKDEEIKTSWQIAHMI